MASRSPFVLEMFVIGPLKREGMSPSPTSPYGVSKLAAENSHGLKTFFGEDSEMAKRPVKSKGRRA